MANLAGAVASSSTASSSASASPPHFDVFINHRGPDVKNTFASHLYRGLLNRGLRAFLDREEMEKGDDISSQIEHAIRCASVHIAIFSPRYAESNWCLNELVLMIKSGATILPVFYKVDPSVVRWTVKEGAYAEALRGLQQKTIQNPETGEKKPRYCSDTIQNWRDALSHVANLSGFTLFGDEDDEGQLLDEVVERVLKKVPKAPLDVAKYPTGLDLKLEEFEKTVLSQQFPEMERVVAKVVGIVGVGGVGKTTLAKKFFNNNRSCYSTSSFLSDVREVAGRKSLSDLQSMLIKDLKHMEITIRPHEGIEILKRHLSLCYALIILDDVDHVDQLESILPIKDIINPNSLILVTSRDKHVLKSSGVVDSLIYNLKGLDIPHSKELFCSYALNQPLPPPEFADLVDLFLAACSGLPLSLKVIGALLCGESDKCYWQEQLELLNHTLPDEVFKTLRISYDSLNKQDQATFLDIACFFLGEDIEKGKRIWGKVGLKNLENKCLLEVDTDNKIKMHDHIRDMARNIAKEPTMPRRLWESTTNIIDNLLEQPSYAMVQVRGIKTVSSSIDFFRDRFCYGGSSDSAVKYPFNTSHFLGMRNLQLVATQEDHLEDILTRVQALHLIWLRWYRFSHSSLPDWIQRKNLKVLEMEGSRLNILWPDQSQGVPLDLRELNICAPLSEIPKSIGQLKYLERIAIFDRNVVPMERLPDEFCRLGSLKYLDLRSFSQMVSLPDSFGELTNLQYIYLKGAFSLQTLPDSFGKITNLQQIYLGGASSLQTLPDSFGELTNLQHIDLEGASSLQALPDSFGKLTRLKHLSLWGCKSLTISRGTLGDITTLEYLDLSYCEHVNELPPQVAHQLSLQTLYLYPTKLKELPRVGCNLKVLECGGDLLEMLLPGLPELKSLERLSVYSSPQLKSLPESTGLLTQLTELKISNCGIEYLPLSLLKMNLLKSLEVRHCPLREHPFKKEVEGERETEGETTLNKFNSSNDRCMFGLQRLDLLGTEIREVYFYDCVCPNLQELTLTRCYELRQIGGLCRLPKLRDLKISDCAKVEELSGLETLTSLVELSAWGCEKLKSISGLGQPTKLRRLHVGGFCEIQALQVLEHLTSLEELSVYGCEKLHCIPGLGQLTKLRVLHVMECREIQALPGVEHLAFLEILGVESCEKLQSIPGLAQLRKLRRLYVNECREIQALPGVEHLAFLESLSVRSCEKLQSIPMSGQLTKLRELHVNRCREIQALPVLEHLTSLEILSVRECEKLQSIPQLGQLTKLTILNFSKCHEIQELHSIEHLTSLRDLIVSGLQRLKSIQGLGQLTELRQLDVSKCNQISTLPGLEHLTSLKKLNVSQCNQISALPGLEHLTSLKKLNVSGLGKLKSIQGLGQLTQITKLNVSECHEISELSGVEYLTSLEKLNISGLGKLKSIQGLGQLTQIIELDVSKCHGISKLRGVEHLTSLKKLNISGLGKLKSIPGLPHLTKIRELNVSKCCELQELPGVEYLISLKVINACECPKLRWREGVLEQLHQHLKEGFKYEKHKKGCSCLEFLQFLWS